MEKLDLVIEKLLELQTKIKKTKETIFICPNLTEYHNLGYIGNSTLDELEDIILKEGIKLWPNFKSGDPYNWIFTKCSQNWTKDYVYKLANLRVEVINLLINHLISKQNEKRTKLFNILNELLKDLHIFECSNVHLCTRIDSWKYSELITVKEHYDLEKIIKDTGLTIDKRFELSYGYEYYFSLKDPYATRSSFVKKSNMVRIEVVEKFIEYFKNKESKKENKPE